MGIDDLQHLRAEQERILAMPGRAAWAKLARLSRTAKVFRGNAEALLGHLKRMDNIGYMLATTSDPQAFEEFLDEVERHLHNYVAAAHTRVDHFRRFQREDMPEGFREEYQRRIDAEFKAAPLHRFIIDLRHLMLHVRLPVSTTTETWGPSSTWSLQVMLDSADLLERWDEWSPEARQYIEANGKSVDIGRTVGHLHREGDRVRWVGDEGLHPGALAGHRAVLPHGAAASGKVAPVGALRRPPDTLVVCLHDDLPPTCLEPSARAPRGHKRLLERTRGGIA
jgi:hypothetical protein